MDDAPNKQQGLQSLNHALDVLTYLSAQPGPTSLSDIARGLNMPPSKAHRYLASFVQFGLVAQTGRSGEYGLGPAALELGLAAMARHDFINAASDALPGLARHVGMTALLAIWGNQGPTVVRWERGPSPTVTSFGLGTALPLLTSATGRAYLAYAPEAAVSELKAQELKRLRQNPALAPDIAPDIAGQGAVEKMRMQVRAAGVSTVDGAFIPGLVAAAAPILDWQGEAQAVVTLVGTDPSTIQPGSKAVEALVSFCMAQSLPRPQYLNERPAGLARKRPS
ncbi:MAG: IclR family transcriptional regulator [Pseudomonadota bacterium]